MTLMLWPTRVRVAWGPAWAVLCGALAVGSLWRLEQWWQADRLLALLLTLLLAEVLWSSWRGILVDMRWADLLAAHPLPEHGYPVLVPPFTTPWSLLGRLLGDWARRRRWADQALSPEQRGAWMALPVLPPLIVVVSALGGPATFLLSLAALSLAVLEWRLGRGNRSCPGLQAALEIGLSWLAGHLVFAPLTVESLVLACGYAVAYQGALMLLQGSYSRWPVWMYGGQAVAMGLLVLLRRPAAALAVGLLMAPQMLLLDDGYDRVGLLRRAAPFVAAAMGVAAMGVAAWSVATGAV